MRCTFWCVCGRDCRDWPRVKSSIVPWTSDLDRTRWGWSASQQCTSFRFVLCFHWPWSRLPQPHDACLSRLEQTTMDQTQSGAKRIFSLLLLLDILMMVTQYVRNTCFPLFTSIHVKTRNWGLAELSPWKGKQREWHVGIWKSGHRCAKQGTVRLVGWFH